MAAAKKIYHRRDGGFGWWEGWAIADLQISWRIMMFPRKKKNNAKSSFMWHEAVFLDCYILFSQNTRNIWDHRKKSTIFTDTTAKECMLEKWPLEWVWILERQPLDTIEWHWLSMVPSHCIGETVHPSGLLKKGPDFFSGRPPPCDNLYVDYEY